MNAAKQEPCCHTLLKRKEDILHLFYRAKSPDINVGSLLINKVDDNRENNTQDNTGDDHELDRKKYFYHYHSSFHRYTCNTEKTSRRLKIGNRVVIATQLNQVKP